MSEYHKIEGAETTSLPTHVGISYFDGMYSVRLCDPSGNVINTVNIPQSWLTAVKEKSKELNGSPGNAITD